MLVPSIPYICLAFWSSELASMLASSAWEDVTVICWALAKILLMLILLGTSNQYTAHTAADPLAVLFEATGSTHSAEFRSPSCILIVKRNVHRCRPTVRACRL